MTDRFEATQHPVLRQLGSFLKHDLMRLEVCLQLCLKFVGAATLLNTALKMTDYIMSLMATISVMLLKKSICCAPVYKARSSG